MKSGRLSHLVENAMKRNKDNKMVKIKNAEVLDLETDKMLKALNTCRIMNPGVIDGGTYIMEHITEMNVPTFTLYLKTIMVTIRPRFLQYKGMLVQYNMVRELFSIHNMEGDFSMSELVTILLDAFHKSKRG